MTLAPASYARAYGNYRKYNEGKPITEVITVYDSSRMEKSVSVIHRATSVLWPRILVKVLSTFNIVIIIV